MYTSMLPTTPRRRLPDGLANTPISSPPSTFLSDAPDGLFENPPFSTPLRPVEQDDYNEEEWQDIDHGIDSLNMNLTSSFVESLPATTIAAKLERILRAIRAERWTVRDLLAAFVQETDRTGREILLNIRGYRSPKERRNTVADVLNSQPFQGLVQESSTLAVPTYIKELTDLRATREPYFQRFQHTDDEKLQELNFSDAFNLIEEKAPRWHAALVALLSNQRSHRKSFILPKDQKKSHEKIAKQVFMITSMICFSQARNQSNFFATAMDIYLIGSGVKRRVIETLSGLGICHSYSKANKALHDVADAARNKIKELGKHPQAVIVYDNINFKDTKRDEHVGHKATMQAMTTACIIHCPFLPENGLTQSMHDPTVQLDFKDILTSPGLSEDDKGKEISRALISDAVRRVHGPGVGCIFKDPDAEAPRMPVFDKLEPKVTKYWQLGAIYEDEGSITGTYRVHDNIFLRQLGLSSPNLTTSTTVTALDPTTPHSPAATALFDTQQRTRRSTRFQAHVEDEIAQDIDMQDSLGPASIPTIPSVTSINQERERDDFLERLWLVHGDQLTAHHIRSVKDEQGLADTPYTRRNWLLGIPAWFHIQMNLLNTIVRTHWSPEQASDAAHHCLQADMTIWGRSAATRDNPMYHVLEPIVAQSYTSRVVALFYAAMERKHYIMDRDAARLERPDSMDEVIGKLTPSQYMELLEDVRVTAFTSGAWDGDGHFDLEFQTMCRMLQEIEVFLTTRHAIKYGDIGLLRRMVDPLIVLFLGASQWNYGHEMLFYRWLLSKDVCTPELQHAILASGIVNWPGQETTHKPIDLGLEHDNGKLKINMKCYQNSTHDTDLIFDRVCLTNTFVGALRTLLEGIFGEKMSGTHTTASAILDMFTLARSIFTGDLATPRDASIMRGYHNVFMSQDIIQMGFDKLEEKVAYFNNNYTRRSALSRGSYNARVDGTVERNADEDVNNEQAEIYGEVIDDRADGILDPTADTEVMRDEQANQEEVAAAVADT